MHKGLLRLLALACLLSAGNIYYAQPLLGEMATAFGRGPRDIGLIPVLCQMGYVAGLILLSPLADVTNNKKFLVRLLGAEAVALVAFASAQSFAFLCVCSFVLGFTSILVQIAFPLVASLSAPEDRAANLGLVIGSALIGILLSRTLSGWVGGLSDWRMVYAAAAGLLLVLAALLQFFLPDQPARGRMGYGELVKSLADLFLQTPALRTIGCNGALLYAALSSFWATLAFFLKDQFHLGPEAAGTFGLIGALGALSASQAGKLIARLGSRRMIQACMATMIAAFVMMAMARTSLIGLVLGVIVLDVGAQAATVTNQNDLYSLRADAQARLNTIYKVMYFLGGALGSSVSVMAWVHWGWVGVCCASCGFLGLAVTHDQLFAKRGRQVELASVGA